ncbi:hypothetical protein [Fibrella aestuarina]|nr:hypothetical protein [Fibrella aestuarina]
MRNFFLVGLTFTLCLFINSCTPELVSPVAPAAKVAAVTHSKARIPTTYIDWENAEFFYYKRSDGQVIQVRTPWAAGGSAVFPFYTVQDRFRRDGWELVYNYFDPNQFVDDKLFFILYNKYRGILRVFFRNTSAVPAASNYILHQLRLGSSVNYNTSQLNFSTDEAKAMDILVDKPFTAGTNTTPLSNNTGALNDAWYTFDYEFAYDPNTPNINGLQVGLDLEARAVSEKRLEITGTIDGTIEGTINVSGDSGGQLFSTLFSKTSNATNISNIVGSVSTGGSNGAAKNGIFKLIGSAATSGLTTAVKNAANTLASGGLNILTTPLTKFFSSIIASPAQNVQNTDLKLKAQTKANGTQTDEFLLFSQHFFLPGTARTDPNTPGVIPYYDKPLGVFNLSRMPIIHVSKYDELAARYELDSPTITLNPAISGEVTVRNQNITMVWYYEGAGGIDFNSANRNPILISQSTAGTWYDVSTNFAIYGLARNPARRLNFGVQVSFELVDGNGQVTYISKMFKPTMDYQDGL